MSYKIVITGTGLMPSIVTETEPAVTPPVTPPTPPVTPPVDTTPFVWPPEWSAAEDYAARPAGVWKILGRADDDPESRCFAYIAGPGNPVGRSHHNAGLIQAGPVVGTRLWAPYSAPAAMLRQLITTGVWP